MNIPPPLPDEHVLGWRGRLKLFNHHPSVRDTKSELRLSFGQSFSDWSVPIDNIPELILLAKASGMELDVFARKHSLLPFIRAFLPDICQSDLTVRKNRNVIKFFGMRTGKDGAWFCPECVSEDLNVVGMPYWRRSHQLFAVDWCVHHRTQLLGINNKKAFDESPPVRFDPKDMLQSDGEASLDDEHPIIQRYVAISKTLLEREYPLNYKKVGTMLRARAVKMMSKNPKKQRVNLNQVAEDMFPEYWKKYFLAVKGENVARQLTDFNKVFKHTRTACRTKYYVVAFSLLFESADEATRSFETSEEIKLKDPGKAVFYGGRKFWNSKNVFDTYVRNLGGYTGVAFDLCINRYSVSNALTDIGFPALGKVKPLIIKALADFYAGDSLADVCKRYGLESDDLEQLIRKGGVRFGKALSKMKL